MLIGLTPDLPQILQDVVGNPVFSGRFWMKKMVDVDVDVVVLL
jgi:hypothetical protein